MSSDFNRTNIDYYLYLVAKEYKKINTEYVDSMADASWKPLSDEL